MAESNFKVTDVVWIKDPKDGYWPAIIETMPNPKELKHAKVAVNLIGKTSRLQLPVSALTPFKNYNPESLRANPKLRDAVFAARRINIGDSTYESNLLVELQNA